MPPTVLISALEGIRRRLRVMSVAFGAGVVIGASVGLLLLVVLLDWLLNLPNVPRLVLMLAAVGTLAYLLYGWVVAPLVAKLSIRDVASHLERAFPQFEDRLRSTVDFVRGDVPGSDFMKQRVVGETTKLASSLDLSQAIVMRPVWYSLGGAVLSVALLIALTMLASPQFMKIAASRLFTPMHAMAWPKSTEIQLLGDIPTRVPVGQRVDVRMKLAKGDRDSAKAIVFTQYGHIENGRFVADTQPQQEFMSRGPDGSYAASLDARVEAPNANGAATSGLMRVWITSGDDQTNLQDIVVVPRLAIRGVSATIQPPAYVGVDHSTTFDLTKGPAVMPMGSKVKLDVLFNKPLAGEAKDVTIEPIDAKPDKPAPQIVSSSFVDDPRDGITHVLSVPESVRFHVRARDTDGFSNAALEEYELIVRPDQNPSVQIENPRRNEERTNVSVVPLQGLAEDDYGIASLKLVVDRVATGTGNEKATAKHWEIPLVAGGGATNSASFTRAEGGGDRLRWRLNYAWDLAQLEKTSPLKPGDVVEYWLVATDNFNLDGKTHAPVNSGKLRISIISQEDLTARIVDDLRNVKQNIGQTKNNQDRTKQETNTLAEDTKDKPDFDAADKAAAERLANQQATSATQSKALAGKLEAVQQRLDENKSNAQELKDIARDVKNALNDAAENAMKDASQQINSASQSKSDPSKRNDALGKAQQDQAKASDQLARAMDRMENIGTLQQTIDAINKILETQRNVSKETADVGSKNLGKKPEEMSPEDRDRLNKAADQQGKLAQETSKALSSMQKTSEQMKQSDPSSAEAMKQAAQTGTNQQVSQNQNKASQQAKQNQQSQAQATQKQVELGLQMVLNQLKEAERRKLAELSKQLAELQKQVANLVRRQAGHNIDNLALTDRLGKMES
jgi:hypothetical protein